MSPSEMEDRRKGLEAYLTALSGLKQSWQSSIVTKVLCEETASPATDQVSFSLEPVLIVAVRGASLLFFVSLPLPPTLPLSLDLARFSCAALPLFSTLSGGVFYVPSEHEARLLGGFSGADGRLPLACLGACVVHAFAHAYS